MPQSRPRLRKRAQYRALQRTLDERLHAALSPQPPPTLAVAWGCRIAGPASAAGRRRPPSSEGPRSGFADAVLRRSPVAGPPTVGGGPTTIRASLSPPPAHGCRGLQRQERDPRSSPELAPRSTAGARRVGYRRLRSNLMLIRAPPLTRHTGAGSPPSPHRCAATCSDRAAPSLVGAPRGPNSNHPLV